MKIVCMRDKICLLPEELLFFRQPLVMWCVSALMTWAVILSMLQVQEDDDTSIHTSIASPLDSVLDRKLLPTRLSALWEIRVTQKQRLPICTLACTYCDKL